MQYSAQNCSLLDRTCDPVLYSSRLALVLKNFKQGRQWLRDLQDLPICPTHTELVSTFALRDLLGLFLQEDAGPLEVERHSAQAEQHEDEQ